MISGLIFPFDPQFLDRFSPSYDGNSIQNADRVITMQFGDGYAKYVRDGENWEKHKFSYSWKHVAFTDLRALPTFLIPENGDCSALRHIAVGNILYQFFENVRTITPFQFTLPKVNLIRPVRCTSIKYAFPTFNTCDISVDMETDYTLIRELEEPTGNIQITWW